MIKKFGLAAIMLLMMDSANAKPVFHVENDNMEVTRENEYMVMNGHIGPYAATMYIEGFSGKNLKGYYVYNDRPNVKFRLKCVKHVMTDSNNLTYVNYEVRLEEYTPKGNHTGTFVGSFCNRAGQYTQFTGTFTNVRNKKKFDFEFLNND